MSTHFPNATDGTGMSSSSSPPSLMKLPPVVERINKNEKMPVCLLIVGMAGSGKSTLVKQLQNNLEELAIAKAEAELEQQQQQQQEKQQQLQQQQKQKQQQVEEEDTKPPATKQQAASSEVDGTPNVSANDNIDNEVGNNDSEENENEATDNDDEEISIDETWYCVNLDPATLQVEYDVAIDIRDTINYKQVMHQHKLGPNGAIMTSLNLFATKFDQVMSILEKRAYGSSSIVQSTLPQQQNDEDDNNNDSTDTENDNNNNNEDTQSSIEYIIVDTPGQIEAFTWSASGSIICESLASAFPTLLVFVIDTVRCAASPNTFMSNMLYACSMFYRTRLPLVIVFNKVDVVSHNFCIEWMTNYEIFQQALDDLPEGGGYYGSLTRSLSLVLDEFYTNFVHAVGVSSITGTGIDEFWTVVQKAATHDFQYDYIDDLKLRIEEQSIRQHAIARTDIHRLQYDLDNNNNNEQQDDQEDDDS